MISLWISARSPLVIPPRFDRRISSGIPQRIPVNIPPEVPFMVRIRVSRISPEIQADFFSLDCFRIYLKISPSILAGNSLDVPSVGTASRMLLLLFF